MQTTTFLQAALNGDRIHPAAPRTPVAIAKAARAAVDAGAQSVHVHAFDDAGRETLEGAACAMVLRAIRALCPGTPISLTTSAAIVGDPDLRFSLIEAWEDRPDFVTAKQGEPGIVELCELLLSRGVGMATAWRVGPSINGDWIEAMASALDWRTSHCCQMVSRHATTRSWLLQPRVWSARVRTSASGHPESLGDDKCPRGAILLEASRRAARRRSARC